MEKDCMSGSGSGSGRVLCVVWGMVVVGGKRN